MRLQLIRYESVELTEQLMREKQKRRAENGDDDSDNSNHAQSQELEEESAPEVQEELRGVLLEEQRAEEPQEGDMLCVLTKDSVLMQLQDTAQQQGMLLD